MAHRQTLLEIFLGKPVGVKLKLFIKLCNAWELRTLKKTLAFYLAENILPKDNPAWLNLYQNLQHPMLELSQLVERYQSLVDPKIVITVIRLPRDLEVVENISSKALLYNSTGISESIVISDLIDRSIKFSCYLQRGKVPTSPFTFNQLDHGMEFLKTISRLYKMNLLHDSHKL
jgi:hypothetical protein